MPPNGSELPADRVGGHRGERESEPPTRSTEQRQVPLSLGGESRGRSLKSTLPETPKNWAVVPVGSIALTGLLPAYS